MTKLALNPIPESGVSQETAPPKNVKPGVAEIVRGAIENGADIATLTRLYLKLRNSKKELEDQAKARIAPINDGLAQIEGHFLDQMNELSVDSLKNEAGTPYRSRKVSITVADNEAFVDFVLTRALAALPVSEAARDGIKKVIVDSGQLTLIEARASKTAIETLYEETKEFPPGLNRREESTVNVRAS